MIDAHAHIFPTIRGYNGNGFIEPLGYGQIHLETGEIRQVLPPAFTDTSCPPEILLRYMDLNEVDRAVLMQGNFYGVPNSYLFEASEKWPDRLSITGMVDPYGTTALQQVDFLSEEYGCKILKFECSSGFGLSSIHPALNFEDEYFSKVFEKANTLGMSITIDTGLPQTRGYQVSALKNVANRYSNLNIVIAHLGFPPGKNKRTENEDLWKEMINVGTLKNVWFDLSNLAGLDGDEYPYPLAQEYIHYAYKKCGADKLIFGTDFPGTLMKCTYHQIISAIRDHCTFLTDEDKEKIFNTNAIKVYRL